MLTPYPRQIDDMIDTIYRSEGWAPGEPPPRGPWTCVGETDGRCGPRHRLARSAAACLVRRAREVGAPPRGDARVSDRRAIRCTAGGPVEVVAELAAACGVSSSSGFPISEDRSCACCGCDPCNCLDGCTHEPGNT